MKLRIAMVGACPYPVPQGSQVLLRDTALVFKERGHDVRLVVYRHGVGDDGSGLPIHRTMRIPGDQRTKSGPSWGKPFQDLALVFALRRVIREQNIDVVCAHNYEALLAALLAGKRPVLYHAHNAMSDELPYYLNNAAWAEWIGRWLDRTFPKRADCIIAPHNRLAGHLIVRGCDHTRVRIVPPPLDANLFTPCQVGGATPPVLYAGNLDAYQNLELLYGAMARVRAALPDARLRVATAERAQLEHVEVVHTPDFNALVALLAEDAVFAAPRVSWSGYPIKLLNAMAAGMAIVACEGAAYPLTDGVNGLVVPNNDEAAFADALVRLLRDPALRKKLGAVARQRILEDHHPDRVGEQLESIAINLYKCAEIAPPEETPPPPEPPLVPPV